MLHPASSPVGTGVFPGVEARPGRDADRLSPSSAKVKKNAYMVYSGTNLPYEIMYLVQQLLPTGDSGICEFVSSSPIGEFDFIFARLFVYT